ncbi:MAG: methyltransferase domain-containing protein [Thermodesulfobacteriota bacterium]
MRQIIKDFIKIASQTLPIVDPIYEFGSLQVPGQEGFADLRPFFPGKEYVGCDLGEGPGVDRIVDVHNINLPSESIGTAIIVDTLEHVEFFREAMTGIHRILKPNGIVIISSVMNFPIHDYPEDYWRFTPNGFKSILRIFPASFVDFVGNTTFPHTVIGVGFKDIATGSTDEFKTRMHSWQQFYHTPPSRHWKNFIKRITPPVLLDLYRKVRYSQQVVVRNQ